MGASLHVHRHFDRTLFADDTKRTGSMAGRRHFYPHRHPHLGDDLSHDDESGLPECKTGRKESERFIRHVDHKLAD